MPSGRYASVVSSPNGEFLYLTTENQAGNGYQNLYVFDTDSSGIPGSTPVQGINVNQLIGMAINPAQTFLYAVRIGSAGPTTTPYYLVRNLIDPATGALSQPVTEATYALDNSPSGNDCYLQILGFNPAGTTLYDAIQCSGPHDSGSETFNQRTVDPQSGALGPDEQVYTFSLAGGNSYAQVQFENNLMFVFVGYDFQGANLNSVQIYQTQPFTNTPLVNCTTTMLTVCGDFTSSRAQPSGKYVFASDVNYFTDILQVDVNTQQLTQVNTIPEYVEQFSPDGSVVYGANGNNGEIWIAGFNAANGEVKLGGHVQPPHRDLWTAAERY